MAFARFLDLEAAEVEDMHALHGHLDIISAVVFELESWFSHS
jgi:hypothetical protein